MASGLLRNALLSDIVSGEPNWVESQTMPGFAATPVIGGNRGLLIVSYLANDDGHVLATEGSFEITAQIVARREDSGQALYSFRELAGIGMGIAVVEEDLEDSVPVWLRIVATSGTVVTATRLVSYWRSL